MDDSDLEGSNESGSALRTKLEAEIAARKAAEGQVAKLAAELVITSGGHTLVKAEDLANVPTDQLAVKAAEVQEARTAEREAIFAEVAKAKGLKLDADGGQAQTLSDEQRRVASLGALGGTPPGQAPPPPANSPKELILRGL